MKLWTVRSKCEKKKKKKASAIKRIKKNWCGSAVYNPLITIVEAFVCFQMNKDRTLCHHIQQWKRHAVFNEWGICFLICYCDKSQIKILNDFARYSEPTGYSFYYNK